MRRFRFLQARPVLTLALLTLATAAVRLVLALGVASPLYYPDEWLYTALSRAALHGHLGVVRGVRVPPSTTIAYVGPLLTAPVWLFSRVETGYRVSQAAGVVSFSTAGPIAYWLARRLGVTAGGSLVVAALTLLVPAAVFTSTLLSEPYSYPAFLLVTIAALYAIAFPTIGRLVVAGLILVGACFAAGGQFAILVPACAIAFVAAAPSVRVAAWRLAGGLVGCGAAVLLLAASTPSFWDWGRGYVEKLTYSPQSLAGWFAVNAFVLAVGSGWLTAPWAIRGFVELAPSREPLQRVFSRLAPVLVLATLAEAAVWGANRQGLYERFAFYGTPLLAIACLKAIEEAREGDRRLHAALFYTAAAAAVLVPLNTEWFGVLDHAPTMVGLDDGLVHTNSPALFWAPVLAVLAVACALVGDRRRELALGGAVAVSLVVSAASARAYAEQHTNRAAQLKVHGAAYLTSIAEDSLSVMRNLFWNPGVDRVAVFGRERTPDGLAVVAGNDPARLSPPFVVGPTTLAFSGARLLTRGGGLASFDRRPTTLLFGWDRRRGSLSGVSRLVASGGPEGRRVVFRLHAPRPTRITFACAGRPARVVSIGLRATTVAVPVPPRRTVFCAISPTAASSNVLARGTVRVR